jgi:uncharacterized protein YkwD
LESITGLRQEGILRGYPDGTFRSAKPVSRVELLKMLLEVLGRYKPVSDVQAAVYQTKGLPFSDILAKQWYVPYLRRAVDLGWIEGYPDGTVRPGDSVSFAEASKLISIAYNMDLDSTEPWYKGPILALGEHNAIPLTVSYLESPLKRGEMAEILWRLRENLTDRAAKSADMILLEHCEILPGGEQVVGVDMKRVEQAWLLWINQDRAKLGLTPYVLNQTLARSAYTWASLSARRGFITHVRSGASSYDYDGILSWFAQQGVSFGNHEGSRYAENIAYGPMECAKEECTREMIGMTRAVFDAFMAEKGTGNDAHYRSVMHPDFRQIGIGISLDPKKSNYYLTVHYAVDALSDEPPLCL